MKKRIKLVQEILKRKGLYTSTVDGLIGPNTLNALSSVDGIDSNWSQKRKIVAAIQIFAEEEGIPCQPVDGLWGPVTQVAFDKLDSITNQKPEKPFFRPEEIEDLNPNNWPKQYTSDFEDFYGDQGSNLVRVDLPYPHKLSWEPSKKVNRISCHQKVAESMIRVLDEVVAVYGLAEISRLRLDVWGGCFNIRSIRGGTKPSMHSWGIAMDYDPNRNRLRWGADKAEFAKPIYNDWWSIWEKEGWVSLGRTRNFDWMHVQAAKI